MQNTALNLNLITRKTDNAFDKGNRWIRWLAKYRDITAFWFIFENPAGKRRNPKRKGIARLAIGKFRDKQIIANKQGRYH
jgi:hypothetical protein